MNEIIGSISWPHITLLLGTLFLFLFRSEISNFILRIKKVSKEGVDADNELNPQSTEARDISDLLDNIEIEKTVLLSEVENAIFKDLKQRNLDHESDTTKVLVRNFAVTCICWEHEKNYNAIFGSQINLLKSLNEVSGSGRNREYVNNHFQELKEEHATVFSAWDLDSYLQYLFVRELITIEGDNYHITHKGQDFLIWMVKQGKVENKAY